MSAFTIYVVMAIAFGLSAPAAGINAVSYFAFGEFWRGTSWAVLTATYVVLAVVNAYRAFGA